MQKYVYGGALAFFLVITGWFVVVRNVVPTNACEIVHAHNDGSQRYTELSAAVCR